MSPANENDIIKTTAPWYAEDALSEADIALIKQYGKKIHFPKGTLIAEAGAYVEQMYYIAQGLAKCTIINSDGEEKVIYYTSQFIALECFFHTQPCGYRSIAMDDMEIYTVERRYSALLLENQKIRDYLLHTLSTQCRILGWQVTDLALSNPLEKICRLLCCYYSTDQAQRKIALTHQEMAAITGLHRVTVTNNITQLKKLGVIQVKESGEIIIIDWEQLKELGFDGCY